jgi:hypothetical protein
MANKPRNVTVNTSLTQYAFGVMQDLEPIRQEAALLAPVVPTGTTNGDYNKFDTTQAFKAYAEAIARRAVGGQANTIGFLSDTATFAAKPNGLRINIDQHERNQVGDNPAGMVLLEQAKVRTLTVNSLVAYLTAVITAVKAAVSATANLGDWGNANVNPISEIDDLMWTVFKQCGILPNVVYMDLGAWRKMRGNPNVLKLFPGAPVAAITPEKVSGLFLNPNARLMVSQTASLYTYGLGNSSATKRGVLAGTALAFFNSLAPTVYDASFAKTFAPSQQLFTEVYTYREEPHFDWFENDWTCDVQIVSASLAGRIDVTGAND